MFKLKDVIKENGATLNKNGIPESYENGYQVSCEDLEIIPKSKLRKKHLIRLLNSLQPNDHLGVWIDKNKAYLDRSVHIIDKDEAMRFGKEKNQISILEWETMNCLSCKE